MRYHVSNVHTSTDEISCKNVVKRLSFHRVGGLYFIEWAVVFAAAIVSMRSDVTPFPSQMRDRVRMLLVSTRSDVTLCLSRGTPTSVPKSSSE